GDRFLIMTIDELLFELRSRGVQLRRSGHELVVLGKRDKLEALLIDELQAHKTTLLDLIGIDTDLWSPSPKITPEMPPLERLSAEEMERLISRVPGEAANIQNIYEGHEAYFRRLLGGVEEPTAPFGTLNVRGDRTGIEEACLEV